jgi:mannitol/fructose-specific phosphotransferase system IIA component (Ntr-type)
MTILAKLARKLVNKQFKQSLLDAPDAASVVAVISKEVLGQ